MLFFLRKPICFAVMASVVGASLSLSAKAEVGDSGLSLDVSVNHVEQSLEQTDGNYTAVTLSPGWEWGDGWQLRADLPWRDANNEVLIPRAKPRIRKLCAWAAAHPHRIQNLLNQGKITQEQLDICNHLDGGVETATAQGMEDITLWFNRLWVLGDRWALQPQLGYKHDNGDEEQGLGTGTRDVMVEVGLSGDFAPFTVDTLLGREHVISQPEDSELDDFSYAECSVGYSFATNWSLGVSAHYETSQLDYYDDMKRFSAQLVWRFLSHYSAALQVSEYNKNSGYPEREMGMSVMASF